VREGRFTAKAAELRQYVPENYRKDYDAIYKVLSGGQVAAAAPQQTPEKTAAPAPGTGTGTGTGATSDGPAHPLTEARVAQIIDERLAAHDAGLVETGKRPAGSWLGFARGGADTILRILGAVLQIGLLAFLIPFYFFFFSVWFPSVVKFCGQLIPRANRKRTIELIGKMDHAVAGFVRGRIVICTIMGGMLAVGWMMCRVPYPLLLGLIVGVFSLVPYLGLIGLPLAVGMLLYGQLGEPEAQRMVLWQIIFWPSLVFAIVQIVEAYILSPMIAGKATNLDPVTIVVAVLAGGSVMGVYGMLLAIPAAACAKILITDVLLPRIRAWTEGRAADPLPLDRG
jgi:predicted PurR-regulated permease PerM